MQTFSTEVKATFPFLELTECNGIPLSSYKTSRAFSETFLRFMGHWWMSVICYKTKQNKICATLLVKHTLEHLVTPYTHEEDEQSSSFPRPSRIASDAWALYLHYWHLSSSQSPTPVPATSSNVWWLAARPVRVFRQLWPLHHLLLRALLHVRQELRSCRGVVLHVWGSLLHPHT